MNHTILLNTDSETAAQIVTAILTRQGYHVLRSFDLRSALVAHPESVCPCHGTSPCNCQFVVLLVYGRAARWWSSLTATIRKPAYRLSPTSRKDPIPIWLER